LTRNQPPTVEVAFARPGCQRVVVVALAADLTAGEAVQASGLLAEFPDLRESSLALGVWGRRVDALHRLRPGDRVEIYRPLRIDPRAARREAARADRPANRRARGRAG
jgi:putative ubiquitin-RnfH superfamily antitoxin RatB of RatAB toxin-antitoxin module